jgi:hypothetical protein
MTSVYERLKNLQIALPGVPPPVVDGYVGAEPNNTSGRRTSPIPHNELSDNRGIRWSRARAATGASERREVYGSFGRNAAILAKRAGRVGLENRMALRRDLPAAAGGMRRAVGQEGLARPCRRQPDQLDLRTSKRQRQGGPGGRDQLLVHSRRRRTQARSRRTGARSGNSELACFEGI